MLRVHAVPPNLQVNVYERLYPDPSTIYRVHEEHGDRDRDLVFDYTLTREIEPTQERDKSELGCDWVIEEERSDTVFNSRMSGCRLARL